MQKNNNDKDYIKLNVAIEYRSNSHLLLVKVRDVTDEDEFNNALHAEIEKTLSKEYPNAEFSPETIPYNVFNFDRKLNSEKPPTEEELFNERITAEVNTLLSMSLNTFIEYRGQRHFLKMPTGHSKERNAAISGFISSKYPNDEFNPNDVLWEHCWPIARFDNYIFESNDNGNFDWAFTQFKNLIEIRVYFSQVEKDVMHNGLAETLKTADGDIKIIKEFVAGGKSTFHLIAFETKYIARTAYAFIGNNCTEHELAEPEKIEPIFSCMTKKEVKKIAEHYMNDAIYKDWFGTRLKIV